jgi:hypothetical protein
VKQQVALAAAALVVGLLATAGSPSSCGGHGRQLKVCVP